jgi:hypothetical protein
MNEIADTLFLPALGAEDAQRAALAPESAAPTRLMSVPDPARRGAYALAYWPQVLRSLLGPHRLRPAAAIEAVSARFVPQADDHLRWCAVFGLDAAAAVGAPFLFSQATGTLLYMRLFADLGLNFRHLLHLRHRATHRPVPELPPGQAQTVSARVASVRALGARKAVVQIACTVSTDDGLVLLQVQDDFIVRGYRPGQLRELERHPAPPFEALHRPAPRWSADAAATIAGSAAGSAADSGPVWQQRFDVDASLGQRYGALSGDANPVHTTPWAARLFGHPRPFLQGLATRSMIVGRLAEAGWQVTRLDLHLCRPVPCGAPVRLAHDGQRFELTDADGLTLLAAGRFEAATSRR